MKKSQRTYSLKLMIISIFLNFLKGSTDIGCLKYDITTKKCLFCDIFNNYIIENGICIKAIYPNCTKYSVWGECQECETNYYLNEGNCSQVATANQIENCGVYQTINSCRICKANHYLLDGKCLKVESDMEGCDQYKTGNWSSCVLCKKGYMLTRDQKSCIKVPEFENCNSYNFIQCKKCKAGFNQNPNIYLKNDLTNLSSKQSLYEWWSVNKIFPVKICEAIVALNCKELISFDECKVCQDGYFLQDKLCYPFPKDSIINCEIYLKGTTCVKCKQGFYIKSPINCAAVTPIENCSEYDPTQNVVKCVQCSNSYILTEDICKVRNSVITNCQVHNASGENCTKCIDGYITTADFKKCLKTIDNCAEYEYSNAFTTNLTCKFCNNNMTFISSNDKCENGKMANCVIYKNNNECFQCVNGYYIPGGDCIKHLQIDNCNTYERVLANKCEVCQNFTYKFNRINKCIKTVQISGCEIFLKVNKCSKCVPNFYLVDTPQDPNKLNECREIDINLNCVQMESNSCTQCKRNYVLVSGVCSSLHDKLQENCASHNADGFTSLTNFKCNYCKTFNYPINLKNTYACTNSANLNSKQYINQCTKYFWNINTLTYKCAFCKEGFFLNDGSCLTDCPLGTYVFLQKIEKQRVGNTATDYVSYSLNFSNICGTLTNGPTGCKKITPNVLYQSLNFDVVDYICVECLSNFFPVLKVLTATNFNPFDLGKGIMGPIVNNPGLDCILITADAIESTTKTANLLVPNCDLYYKLNKTSDTPLYGCYKCKFGYTGIIISSLVANTTGYINTCQAINDINDNDTPDAVDGKCDLNVFYQGYSATKFQIDWNRVPLESLITCHKCQIINGQEYRPFIFIDYINSNTNSSYSYSSNNMNKHVSINKYLIRDGGFQFNSSSGGRMQRCLLPQYSTFFMGSNDFNIFGTGTQSLPLNCSLFIVDITTNRYGAQNSYGTTPNLNFSSVSDKMKIYCASCIPGFKAQRTSNETTGSGSYYLPYYVAQCTAIANCNVGGTWVNHCEFCNTDYVWKWDDTRKTILYDECFYFPSTAVGYTLNCRAADSVGCRVCEKSYELNTFTYSDSTVIKICEKILPGYCNDTDSVFMNTMPASNTNVYFGRNLLFLRRHSTGCNTCREGYVALQLIEDTYICSTSGILTNVSSVTNFTIPNCKNYSRDFDTARLICKVCDLGFVPTNEGKCQNETVSGLQNCLQAVKVSEGVYNCDVCQETFIFLNSKCIKGSIEKCQEFEINKNSTSQNCLKCEDGFYTMTDVCVKGEIKNCKEYTSAKICKTCENGFQLMSLANQVPYCIEIPIDLQCADFVDDDFQQSNLNCLTCRSGYFPDRDAEFPKSYCMPFKVIENCYIYDLKEKIAFSTFACVQCNLNFYLDLKSLVCIQRTKIDPNCIRIDKNLDVCLECKNGFYLSDNNLDCFENPSGVPGCRIYENKNICSRCVENRYLLNNQCILIPEEIRIGFCKFYAAENKCEECDSTHFIQNSGCKDSVANNCAVVSNSTACASCLPNYGMSIDPIQTIKVDCVPFTDKNCLDSTKLFPFQCNQCKDNYYPDKSGVCVEKTKPKIDKCIAYLSEDLCQICIPGLVLSIDKKSCESSVFYDPFIDVNCENTLVTTPAVCTSCAAGYFFSKDLCVKCEKKTLEAGCTYCDPLDNNVCIICASGYYMNDKLECVKSNTVIPDNSETPKTDDVVKNILNFLQRYFTFLVALNLL